MYIQLSQSSRMHVSVSLSVLLQVSDGNFSSVQLLVHVDALECFLYAFLLRWLGLLTFSILPKINGCIWRELIQGSLIGRQSQEVIQRVIGQQGSFVRFDGIDLRKKPFKLSI